MDCYICYTSNYQILFIMKKSLLLAVAFCLTTLTFAGNADLFKVDNQAINKEFASLTSLENFVASNNFVTLTDIQASNSFDLSGLNVNNMRSSSGEGEFAFKWEGFLWGFLCCPVGFFVIAVNKNKDHDQKLSYWIGVLASTVIGAIRTATYSY
jgi:hypothetical protein